MNLPNFDFDGNWVDVCSIVTGFAYIAVQRIRRPANPKFVSKPTGMDFANGAALFPLLLLTFCPFSSSLLKGLVEASKMSLAVAGFFALLAILED